MSLNVGQQSVYDQFLNFMLDEDKHSMVIAGSAGTGKSYLTKDLINGVNKQLKLVSLLMGMPADEAIEVVATATTNKAARVIADVVGHDPITIHSFLGLSVFKDFKTGKSKIRVGKNAKKVDSCLIIIDESSFIDSYLLKIIEEQTKNCKILFIGDPFQLTPVGEKTSPVFSRGIETGTLTELVRNPGPIGILSGKFREVLTGGDWPEIIPNGKEILHVDGATFQAMIDDEFLNLKEDNDARILAWTNDRVVEYNDHVRGVLGFPETLSAGERVISNTFLPHYKISVDQHLKILEIGEEETNYGVLGNTVGINGNRHLFVPKRQKDAFNLLKKLAKQKDWRDYYSIKEGWGDLRPIYACTVTKSQGSTYKTVYIDLNDIGSSWIPNNVARLLYVAVSRASHKVVFYGELPKQYSAGAPGIKQ